MCFTGRSEAQWWQDSVISSMILSRSSMKKKRRITCFNWYALGWFNFKCTAVSKPFDKVRGTTIHWRALEKGSFNGTYMRPSDATEATQSLELQGLGVWCSAERIVGCRCDRLRMCTFCLGPWRLGALQGRSSHCGAQGRGFQRW